MKFKSVCLAAFCAILLAFTVCSCVSRDEIEKLNARMGLIEQRVDNLNSEIAGLRLIVQQINNGGYVTAVFPDEDGSGYALAFNDGSSIHISVEGSQPANPQIGVRQDEDGVWYWTLNGQWLLSADGKKMRVTGENGQPGGAGSPGITPRLKFENDVWYVSYDEGASWTKISTKSAESLVFRNVDTSNSDYVVIVLSDGTELKLPTWAAFDALRQCVKQLNINLSSLSSIVSALVQNDYLVSISPFVEDGAPVGWLLNFSKSGLVVIYSSGNSDTPHLGVKQDADGIYYWTLDGEWLLDSDGNKVRAQGSDGQDAATPKLKIEGQYWYISYDDGATWTMLGKATGEDGDSFFSKVDVSNDEFVLLVLSDGGTIKVPKYVALDILLDLPRDLVIDRFESIRIPFSIIGTYRDDVTVTALVNGTFRASVRRTDGQDTGQIVVSEDGDQGGTLVVILSTSNGTAVVKSATFSPRSICLGTSSYDLPKDLYYGSFSAYMSSLGGTLELTYFTNTSFSIDTSGAPWIRVLKDCSRPAGTSGTIVLEVEKNDGYSRIGTLRLSFEDPQWSGTRHNTPEYIFTVNQGGEAVELGASRIEASGIATKYEVEVRSDLSGLTAFPMDSWMRASMQMVSDNVYSLIVDMDKNDGEEPRYSAVYIKSGNTVAGILPVVQYHYDNRFWSNAMVMKVLALQENGSNVCLPFTGTLNLMVDWGDDIVSLHEQVDGTGHPVRHTYSNPGEYTVKVYGKLQAMSTKEPDGSSIASLATIEAVTQWGDCHYVESMENAFCGVTTLVSLASDPYFVFAYVSSFRAAFSGCINLSEVPVNLFEGAWTSRDFTDAFNGVSLATGESPFNVVNGNKEHLYERNDTPAAERSVIYPLVTSYSGCFRGGHWADQDAIHDAGWD